MSFDLGLNTDKVKKYTKFDACSTTPGKLIELGWLDDGREDEEGMDGRSTKGQEGEVGRTREDG